jgi:Flp pilus assembly protein TadG
MIRGRRSRRGQSLVEFALILPVFILVLLGIFDLGRAVYAYNTINNAAREAARLAIVDQTVADIQAEGEAHAVSLGIAAADVDVAFFQTSAGPGTTCTHIGTARAIECTALVRVPYEYTAATPIVGAIVGVLNLTGESQFRVEFNCVDGGGVDCPLGS